MSKNAALQELDPILARNFSHLKITSSDDFSTAQHFALSILGNRKLIQYVRRVTLDYDYWNDTPLSAETFPWTLSPESELKTEAIFKAVIAEQKWEKADATALLMHLMIASSPEFPAALVAILLPILTNVEKWVVRGVTHHSYVGKAIKRAKDGIFGFISITHVELLANSVFAYEAWAYYDFSAFQIFESLPRLKIISGKGIGGSEIEDWGAYYDMSSRVSEIQEIHLKDCDLSGVCLTKIIGFSTGLRAFTYIFGGRSSPDRSTRVLYSPQLAKALIPHRSTLQSLDIDIESLLDGSLEEEVQRWECEFREAESYKMAHGESDSSSQSNGETWNEATQSGPYFPNLKHLRININLALRFSELSDKKTLIEWLPTGLEWLELVGYSPEEADFITSQVVEVVQRREELLPNLKVLNGVEEYIECGRMFDDDEDDIPSDGTIEDSDWGGMID